MVGYMIEHKVGHRVGHKVRHRVGHKVEHRVEHRFGHRVEHRVEHRFAFLSVHLIVLIERKKMSHLATFYDDSIMSYERVSISL